MRAPCENCPFKIEPLFRLTPERVRQIGRDAGEGVHFNCHKTTHETGTGRPLLCAGWLSVAQKQGSARRSNMVRIAERLRVIDLSQLACREDTYDSFEEYAERLENS